MLRNTQIC
uniref:Uncharacterized protein n=1 Tax=Arundo donax TaxID=35708 RepID=A0A0A8ZZ86_ARUDO